jgi:hypothetical protein
VSKPWPSAAVRVCRNRGRLVSQLANAISARLIGHSVATPSPAWLVQGRHLA